MTQHNQKVINKYMILESIGKGAFGEVYKATRMTDNLDVAMKIEKKSAVIPRLIQEYKIYQKLITRKCRHGIPGIHELIQTDDYNIMIMELLGESLEEIFNISNRKFSISTVLFLGANILKIIEKVHNAGFIHRDIKPNNFLIGSVNRQQIYLTDFGLSKQYINNNGKHLKETFNHSMVGTARYSSINMHLGIEPSRRDDLEAIGYLLIYFIKGRLPWQGVCNGKDRRSMFECIGNAKLSTELETLCDELPICFSNYLKYCRNLRFTETPDYAFLVRLFTETIRTNNFSCTYEWV
jgi:serine/threonine protein kinase